MASASDSLRILVDRRPTNAQVREQGRADFRPDVIMCVVQVSGFILAMEAVPPDEGEEAIARVVRQAQEAVRENPPEAPLLWVARQQHVAQTLASALPEAPTAEAPEEDFASWDEAYLDLERHMGKGAGMLPYLWHPETTSEQVAELFEAAVQYRMLRPWQFLDDDNPVRVVSERGEWEPLLVSVMGSAGISRGIAVFDSEADFARIMADRGISGVVYVSLEALGKVPYTVRVQADQHGWKVANKSSFPLLVRVRDSEPAPFHAGDIIRAAAAFRAVSALAREVRASRSAGPARTR